MDFLVSTVTLKMGFYAAKYETMIFPCDPDGGITNYGEIYCDRYTEAHDALDGHQRAVNSFVLSDDMLRRVSDSLGDPLVKDANDLSTGN